MEARNDRFSNIALEIGGIRPQVRAAAAPVNGGFLANRARHADKYGARNCRSSDVDIRSVEGNKGVHSSTSAEGWSESCEIGASTGGSGSADPLEAFLRAREISPGPKAKALILG